MGNLFQKSNNKIHALGERIVTPKGVYQFVEANRKKIRLYYDYHNTDEIVPENVKWMNHIIENKIFLMYGKNYDTDNFIDVIEMKDKVLDVILQSIYKIHKVDVEISSNESSILKIFHFSEDDITLEINKELLTFILDSQDSYFITIPKGIIDKLGKVKKLIYNIKLEENVSYLYIILYHIIAPFCRELEEFTYVQNGIINIDETLFVVLADFISKTNFSSYSFQLKNLEEYHDYNKENDTFSDSVSDLKDQDDEEEIILKPLPKISKDDKDGKTIRHNEKLLTSNFLKSNLGIDAFGDNNRPISAKHQIKPGKIFSSNNLFELKNRVFSSKRRNSKQLTQLEFIQSNSHAIKINQIRSQATPIKSINEDNNLNKIKEDKNESNNVEDDILDEEKSSKQTNKKSDSQDISKQFNKSSSIISSNSLKSGDSSAGSLKTKTKTFDIIEEDLVTEYLDYPLDDDDSIKSYESLNNVQYLFLYFQTLSLKINLIELELLCYIKEYSFVQIAQILQKNKDLKSVKIRNTRYFNEKKVNELDYNYNFYNTQLGIKIKDEIFIFFNCLFQATKLEVLSLNHFWFNSDINFMSCELSISNQNLKSLDLSHNQCVLSNRNYIAQNFSYCKSNLVKLYLGRTYFNKLVHWDIIINNEVLLDFDAGILDFGSLCSLLKYIKNTNIQILKMTLNRSCALEGLKFLFEFYLNLFQSKKIKKITLINCYSDELLEKENVAITNLFNTIIVNPFIASSANELIFTDNRNKIAHNFPSTVKFDEGQLNLVYTLLMCLKKKCKITKKHPKRQVISKNIIDYLYLTNNIIIF